MTAPTDTQPTDIRHRTHQMIFVNLPVADPAASRAFFAELGYGFDEEMCNDSGVAIVLGPNHYAMLLSTEFFAGFHQGTAVQKGQHEVLTCLTAESRDEVDDLVDRAIAAGGTEVRTEDGGEFMHGRSFTDLDGHIWEIMWMDLEKAREAGAFG